MNEGAIVGGGVTFQDCKQEILYCIETLRKLNSCPEFLKTV
jgi:hypothetical protein